MSKIYLPYAAQFDLMNENLMRIASAIGSDMDVSTWAGIQKAVRAGVAPSLLPVGTQLSVSHSNYGPRLYDVVAHDYFKSVHNENAHTMTLMCHDIIQSLRYDVAEAFYYADTMLPAGIYNFTIPTTVGSWDKGTYYFTLTFDVPKGGQLALNGTDDTAIDNLKIIVYANSTTNDTMGGAIDILEGVHGESLGTFGIELNHAHRVSCGSGNYKESAIRQFLNSDAAAGSVWTPQTKFDRPPSWVSTLAGFVNGFDDECLAVVGAVVVPCIANNSYESPDSTTVVGEKYFVRDKFYLASQLEIFGASTETVEDGTSQFPYYKGASGADFLKYYNLTNTPWWGRSPTSWHSGAVRISDGSGKVANRYARDQVGCAPVFTIV